MPKFPFDVVAFENGGCNILMGERNVNFNACNVSLPLLLVALLFVVFLFIISMVLRTLFVGRL